ncbi:MAG TPA: hypothetical protein VKN99_13585 [Polyangia bacterium]|nr:hypothetical protein [Polyangia bacterium]
MSVVRESTHFPQHLEAIEARGEAGLLRAALLELMREGAGAHLRALVDVIAEPNLSSVIERLGRIVERWRIERFAADSRGGLMLAAAWQRLCVALVREQERRMRAGLAPVARGATFGTAAAALLHEMNNRFAWLLADLQVAQRSLVEARSERPWGQQETAALAEVADVLARLDEGIGGLVKSMRSAAALNAVDGAAAPYDLREAVATAVAAAAPIVKVTARLHAEVPPGLLVAGRRHEIERALVSLLVAAGRSREKFCDLVVLGRRRERRAVLAIQGPGGTPGHLTEQLFQPFARAADDEGCLGLCLFLAQEAVHEQGGKVVVGGDGDGEMTLITVELPLS